MLRRDERPPRLVLLLPPTSLVTMSLTPSSLTPLAVSLLPPDETSLTSPIEALGLLVHSIHTQVGFRLVSPASPAAEQGEGGENVINKLPAGWSSNGSLKFKYKHEQSSLDFVISVTELGGRALVAAVAVENPKSTSFDLLLTDYFSHSTFPISALSSAENFTKAFSTPARLADLITLYRLNILQPLIPGLQKDGYTELPASTSTSSASGSGSGQGRVAQPGGPYYPDDGGPLMGIPGRGGGQAFPPPERGGDDPLRIPGSGGRGRLPNPQDVGRSDLLPLGGMGGTFGSAGIGRDIFGGGGLGGGIGGPGGGGMMMGRDEFRERFGGDGTVGGRGGQGDGRRWGGDGYLPPGGAPPGARFDPVGPGNGPAQPGGAGIGGFGGGGGIGSFPGARGGGGSAGRGRFGSGDPDWDGVRPPGSSGNDYDNMFG